MKICTNFIIIDDDSVNNYICEKTIKKVVSNALIFTFTEAIDAIRFLKSGDPGFNSNLNTVIFLDINMPIMSGWDFLNAFHELNIEIKNNVKIYMLSSSINDEDISIAKSNKYVIDYLMKPLQISKLKELFT